MNRPEPAPPRSDWNAFRELWIALVPCAGVSLLAAAGGTLSVLLRVPPPMHGSSPTLVVLYLFAIAAMPVILSSLFAGFYWARTALIVMLWIYIGMTLVSLPQLFGVKPRAGWVMVVFVVPELIALRLAYGTRLRTAARSLEEKRQARWGPGFGLVSAVSACGLFATSSATVLLTEQLRTLGIVDLTNVAKPLRWLPTVAGLLCYAGAVARVPLSRRAIWCVFVLNLLPIVFGVATNGVTNQAGAFALAALVLDAFALVGSTLPAFTGFWERLHAKRGRGSAAR